MRFKTTAVATAIAALAVPSAALATDDHEHKGKSHQKAKKAKSVGFSLSGTELAGLNVTDNKASGPFTLDLTSANKHARTFLGLTKTQIQGDDTTSIPVASDDTFRLRLNGITDGADAGTDVSLADVLATDRVKVVGKVTRVRKGDTTTTRTLDIKKITVTRETETETETEQQS
jgi:hypothetical protein